QWNVLAQQIIFSQIDADPGVGHQFMMDKWDGYVRARRRLTEQIAERKLPNVVILSGDNHNNWVLDVKRDPDDVRSAVVATEFAGTWITSGGDGADMDPKFALILAKNPQVKFHNSQRGYVRCVVTPRQWTSDYRIVPYVTRPGATIRTRISFIVESGQSG